MSRAICQACGHTCGLSRLRPIRDYHQRVAPGEAVPAGECPKCGALSHQINDTPDINRILRADPRPCKYGAPMGASNRDGRPEGYKAKLYCQRVRFIDGDYGADGTYWGGGSPLWCIFTYKSGVDLLRHYERAATRRLALQQFHQE